MLNMELVTIWLSNSTPVYNPREMTYIHTKHLYTDVHGFIHNSKKKKKKSKQPKYPSTDE